MENRSYALATGLFTILLVVAAIATVFWLQRDHTDLVPYDLVTYDSVQGLSPQANVRYRGLQVGKVQSIGFDPTGTGAILVRIGVRPDTPMTDHLKATVEMQGITGIAYIDLDDEGKPGKPIESSAARVARIDMQPGLTERILSRANELMNNLQSVGNEIKDFMGPENQKAFSAILQNTADASHDFRQLLAQLEPLASDLGPLVREAGQATRQAGRAADQIAGLAGDARVALEALMSPDGTIAQATRSLAQLQRTVASLGGSSPQVSAILNDVDETVQTARRALETIERAPQSVLFGAPRVRPGPGEPGFSGFRERTTP